MVIKKKIKDRKEKKVRKIKCIVKVYVKSTFNNTIITATDDKNEVIATTSGGSAGFKNTRKSTPFAAQTATEIMSKKLKAMSVTDIILYLKGLGAGRESVVKGFHEFNILEIHEVTSLAFNGCRLPKARRS